MFYGPNDNPENQRLKDIKPWEIAMAGSFVVLVWGGFYPATFLKPMEASLNATRMMALNPREERPIWSAERKIDPAGNLVRVIGRTRDKVAEYGLPPIR